VPTTERFAGLEQPEPPEDFEPVEPADPEEPELIQQDEAVGTADPGEADPVDVAEQDAVVDHDDDGYDREE
jgi:hypothetical protein